MKGRPARASLIQGSRSDSDLEIQAVNGAARIVQDDPQGTYNACFEADKRKNCSYRP